MNLNYLPFEPLPWRCPCGAQAAKKYSLCRKCEARDMWQRRTTRSRRFRHTLRRLFWVVAK